MSTTTQKKHLPGITVDPNIPDYSKDRLISEKLERAHAFFAKNGLPKNNKKKQSNAVIYYA
ncbi:MAG: hypothetical protein P4L51_10100 [Puia sp.]|nr:hypothetical protein [Puia sp.]